MHPLNPATAAGLILVGDVRLAAAPFADLV